MAQVRALLIPADDDEPVRVLTVDGSWEGMRAALKARTLNPVDLGDDITVWVDEYGKLERMPVNPRACVLVNSYIPGYTRHDLLHGPAIFVSMDEDTAEYRDLPDDVIERYTRLNEPLQP